MTNDEQLRRRRLLFVVRASLFLRPSSFGLRHSLAISSRLELRWALSFSHGPGDGDVGQFATIDSAAKQKSAPAHIAATDEIGGETKTLPEMFEEDVDVFCGRNAAEQDNFAVSRQLLREAFHVTFERNAITRLCLVNVDSGEFLKIGQADGSCCRNQSAGRRNNENG